MADPTVAVSIQKTDGTWVDISADLISGSIRRGRQNELDRYQAGTCELVLSNDDRDYDPTYAAGPLYGHILPMRPVKITATYAAVTYPLFYGYADRWTQRAEGPHRAVTTLQATDGFKVLSRANLASSAYAQEVAADAPTHWWRFDEAGGTVAHDAAGDLDLAAFGAPTLGAETLLARDPGAAVELEAATDGLYFEGQMPLATGPLTVEAILKVTTTNVVLGSASHFQGFGFVLEGNPALGFTVATSPGVAMSVPSSVAYADGATHHVVGVWNTNGTGKIYVDGVDTTTGSPSLTIAPFSGTQGFTFIGASPPFNGTPGIFDEVAFYDHALSPTRIAAHAAAVATPWDGDLPGPRITRVLDAVDWPAGLRSVDTGTTVLQSATLDMDALTHVQKVAETEGGNVYVTADGTLRFEARSSGVNQPVVATFSDAAGGDLPIVYSDPEISDEDIRNDVTVSRLEGSAQQLEDAASIAVYQRSSYVRDGLYHDDDTHSRYMAQFILEAYKDPVERVAQMTVNPYADPADLWPAILAVELTDRLVLNETPVNVAPEVSRTVVVEGVAHTFGPKQWGAAFNLSENTVATQGYWALGVAGFSELGQTTRLFY